MIDKIKCLFGFHKPRYANASSVGDGMLVTYECALCRCFVETKIVSIESWVRLYNRRQREKD